MGVEQNADRLQNLTDCVGQFDVGGRRLADAGRVVVGEDHRGGLGVDRLFEHFAGVDRGPVDGSGDHVETEQVVLRIQKQYHEGLLFATAELHAQEVHDFRGVVEHVDIAGLLFHIFGA